MGYIEQSLMTGEKVIYQTKLHWAVFVWPGIFFIVGVLFIIKLESSGIPLGGLFIVAAILMEVSSFVRYSTSEFAVTSKRVLIKVGFIRRYSFELLLTKVEGIGVKQGILGRILNYGTIVVTGTGGTKEPFHMINIPLEFRKWVQEQISIVQESK